MRPFARIRAGRHAARAPALIVPIFCCIGLPGALVAMKRKGRRSPGQRADAKGSTAASDAVAVKPLSNRPSIRLLGIDTPADGG